MEQDPDALRRFLQIYDKYVREVLQPTQQELRTLFQNWRQPDFWIKEPSTRLPAPSPIQFARTRVKRPEAASDKILRNAAHFPDGLSFQSLQRMTDAVAGRIVVYFLSQLSLIDREMRANDDFELSPNQEPIAFLPRDVLERLGLAHIRPRVKDSGYASIHYIVRLRQTTVPSDLRPWFEIQLRTAAENLWGDVEHVLGYKPAKRTSFAVRKNFQILSAHLQAIDEHFNLLAEELSRFQVEVSFDDMDPLNAENLPAVLAEIGSGCAQREIDSLLRLLNSRQVSTVAALRTVATNRRMEIIRSIYRYEERRDPSNFEMIATLAALRGIQDEERISEAIKTQIDFLKSWERFKKDAEENGDET